MNKNFWLIIFIVMLFGLSEIARAQTGLEGKLDIKVGIGGLLLAQEETNANILVGAMEAELTKKYNKLISGSVAVGLGYGNRTSIISEDLKHYALATHVDGNVFLSPFGNNRNYNLKLGTGATILYMNHWYKNKGDVVPDNPEGKLLPGLNLILENEFSVGEKSLASIKAMAQPYSNGDWSGTLLFKYGYRIM
ncbi:hypothetical protein [Pontibacter vulgaris]|uniref:hypothetical protein n=1 Tax=Pontibacter vulgaris TaxID=2905679 RepID=UPI001FA72ED0|nr:hypothetical protein [Pontibacter vulgaris]